MVQRGLQHRRLNGALYHESEENECVQDTGMNDCKT